jgi:WD40 repeat protein
MTAGGAEDNHVIGEIDEYIHSDEPFEVSWVAKTQVEPLFQPSDIKPLSDGKTNTYETTSIACFKTNTWWIEDMSFSPDGLLLAGMSSRSEIRIWQSEKKVCTSEAYA